MSRLVVADTGPLIHLSQANALSLLELTGEILVPKTVLDELERGPTDVSDSSSQSNGSIPTPDPCIHVSIRARLLHSWSVPNAARYS